MIEVVYIVSAELDYNLLICADAGPAYANTMGWQWDTITNIRQYLTQDVVLVLDTRMEAAEYEALYTIVTNNPQTIFIATVTDPYFHDSMDKPLYKFLFRTATLNNVRYLTQYQPEEIVRFLQHVKGGHNIVVINYPYQKEKELDKPFAGRKKKILFSGSISSYMYPERYQFWRSYTRSPWRIKIDTLAHPGYPGRGQQFAHQTIGDNYIRHLAGYQFMFLGASRWSVELMKYTECAYAGCVPVGFAPATFDESLKRLVIPIDSARLTKSLFKLFSIPQKELQDIASEYRHCLSVQRDRDLLNKAFTSFVNDAHRLHFV